MPKKELRVKNYEFRIKQILKFYTLHSAFYTQKGLASLLIILLLIAGIGLGNYLVQQRINIIF